MIRTFVGFCVVSLGACSAGSSPTTAEPPLPRTIADVTTTLDFGNAPFEGVLRLAPNQGADLRYAIDLDQDGVPDESGPVGLGVLVGYRYTTPGPHRIAVTLTNATGTLSLERTVVVNDPTVLQTAIRRTLQGLGSAGLGPNLPGMAVDPESDRLWITAPYDDTVLELYASQLTEIRRAALVMEDFSEELGGIEVSADGQALYVDTGDSLMRIDVSEAAIGRAEGFARADRGNLVERLPDGDLITGGVRGILRVDAATGATEAERTSFQGGGDLEPSPDGDGVAWIESSELRLLSADDLSDRWSASVPFHFFAALMFDSSGDRLFALMRESESEDWVLYVFMTETGEVERRLLIAKTVRGTRSPVVTRPAARTSDGRHVVFATEMGALVVDAATGLPVAGELDLSLEEDFGCCNVVSDGNGVVFAPASTYESRIMRMRIQR